MDIVGSVKADRVLLMSVNRRRNFAIPVPAMVVASPSWSGVAAQARVEGRTVRIAVLGRSSRPPAGYGCYDALLAELAKAGWIEGRNLIIEWRYADGEYDRHDVLAAEPVALRPDLIVAASRKVWVAGLLARRRSGLVLGQL